MPHLANDLGVGAPPKRLHDALGTNGFPDFLATTQTRIRSQRMTAKPSIAPRKRESKEKQA